MGKLYEGVFVMCICVLLLAPQVYADSKEPMQVKVSIGSYKVRERTYSVAPQSGEFTPEVRRNEAVNDYFRSRINGQDSIYVLFQVDTGTGDLTREQMEQLLTDGVSLRQLLDGDHVYVGRFATSILLNKQYDFIRWAGVIEDVRQKMRPHHREYLERAGELPLRIDFYGGITTEEYGQLKKLGNLEWEYANYSYVVMDVEYENLNELLALNFVESALYINPKPLSAG